MSVIQRRIIVYDRCLARLFMGWVKPIIHCHVRSRGRLIMTSLTKTCPAPQILSMRRLKKWHHGTDFNLSWWLHQMETFSALLDLCAGNSPVTGEFPTQRPMTRSFDVFFDLCLNKCLSNQSRGWWFEAPSRPSWRHGNVMIFTIEKQHR